MSSPPRAKPGIPLEIFDIASNIYANALNRLNNDQISDTAFMQRIAESSLQHAYFLHNHITATDPPTIPANVDVPHLYQQGTLLTCTMGNWNGTPSTYSYQWKTNVSPPPTDLIDLNAPSFIIQPHHVGIIATCTVTASNFLGSTTAPPSNSVTITGEPT